MFMRDGIIVVGLWLLLFSLSLLLSYIFVVVTWSSCLCFDLVTPGEYNLKLNPVTLDDDGVYQCQVGTGKRDEPAIRSRKATLTVLVPPDRPRIVQGDKIYTTENSPIELECISEGGKPKAEVSAEAFHVLFIRH